MQAERLRLAVLLARCALGAFLLLVSVGCATQSLNRARTDFYSGRLDDAEATLDRDRIPQRDEVLFLMERGTVRQMQGEYAASSRDFIAAHDRLVELETRSVSRGAGSLIVNDNIRHFVGAPFERTLLHTLTAQNHFALGDWDNAAVEARRILRSLDHESRLDFPDEPFSRYVAGLAFQFLDDPSNAALQFRLANDLVPPVRINPDSGRLRQEKTPPPKEKSEHTEESDDVEEESRIERIWPEPLSDREPDIPETWTDELVVLLHLGRAPRRQSVGRSPFSYRAPTYAEIYVEGRYVGRTYTLSDTAYLRAETERVRALREAARAVTRIVAKEAASEAVGRNTEPWVGDLMRFILFGLLEQPDERHWGTLPRWLQVGRVAAPPGLSEYTLVFKDSRGREQRRVDVNESIQRRRNLAVSSHRELLAR